MSETEIVIPLTRPLELRGRDGKVIVSMAELKLRPPTAGDLADAMDAEGGKGSMMRALVCRCAGITRADFDNIALADAAPIFEAVTRFFPSGQTTGGTP